MGRDWSSRTREAEHVATQAWEDLLAAVEQAGEAARSVTKRGLDLADEAGSRFGSATDEAKTRAKRARNALAGRPAPVPWAWIAGAALAGAAVGWLAGSAARRAVQSMNDLALEDEPVVATAPVRSPSTES